MTLQSLGVLPAGHGFAEFGALRGLDGTATAYGTAGWHIAAGVSAFAGGSATQDGLLTGQAGLRWDF